LTNRKLSGLVSEQPLPATAQSICTEVNTGGLLNACWATCPVRWSKYRPAPVRITQLLAGRQAMPSRGMKLFRSLFSVLGGTPFTPPCTMPAASSEPMPVYLSGYQLVIARL